MRNNNDVVLDVHRPTKASNVQPGALTMTSHKRRSARPHVSKGAFKQSRRSQPGGLLCPGKPTLTLPGSLSHDHCWEVYNTMGRGRKRLLELLEPKWRCVVWDTHTSTCKHRHVHVCRCGCTRVLIKLIADKCVFHLDAHTHACKNPHHAFHLPARLSATPPRLRRSLPAHHDGSNQRKSRHRQNHRLPRVRNARKRKGK